MSGDETNSVECDERQCPTFGNLNLNLPVGGYVNPSEPVGVVYDEDDPR